MLANVYVALGSFLIGIIAGAVSGLRFESETFLGGYGDWRRRLVRLAHISFFGIGLLNLVCALTARSFGISEGLTVASILLTIGAVTMPLLCYLAAFRKPFRHLFFIPVLSVFLGIAILLWKVVTL